MKFRIIRRKEDGTDTTLDMDTLSMGALYDEAWDAVDPEVKERCVRHLRKQISDTDMQVIRDMHRKHGPHEWVFEVGHHGFGTAARNCLREVCADAELPPFDAYYGEGTNCRNWDDYYVQALEAAAGLR